MPTIALHDAVTVHADDTDGVEMVTIFVTMSGHARELVYVSATGGEAGGAGTFDGRFTNTARNAVTDGFEYVFKRAGGWRSASMTVTAEVVDSAGEMTVTTTSFTVTSPAALAVSALTPTPAATPGTPGAFSADLAVAKRTPITFAVRGAAVVFVFVRYTNASTRELVYEGTGGAGFTAGYATSSVTPSDVDLDFSILPVGGWRHSIACLAVVAFDDLGSYINLGDA